MNHFATPVRIAADQFTRDHKITGSFTLRSFLTGALNFLVGTFIRRDDAAKRYEGCAWCDQIEHDLNDDVMTGRHTRPRS